MVADHAQAFNTAECRAALTNCSWLEDSSTCVEGYTIYGSPWQPAFFDWAFNLPRGEPCRQAWQRIPRSGVDILMTHGPPIGGCVFAGLCVFVRGCRCVSSKRVRWPSATTVSGGQTA
jgi:hypothetical protein